MPVVIVYAGVATIYAEIGQPLYCDRGNGWVYAERTPPWVALPVTWYESGLARCGDTVTLWGDGWSGRYLALDAGPLEGHYVEDWPDLPIVADVPEFLAEFDGLSARVRVVNTSAIKRGMEEMR